MKKTVVAKLALAGTVGIVAALASGTADAASCVACHTMHNSQDNAPMRFDSGATPLPILLRDDCIGCHSGANTGTSILSSPPKVIGLAAPTYGTDTLAGGDFYWVSDTGFNNDAKGHNVNLVSAADGNMPANSRPGGTAWTTQLECAGTNGCHGDTTAGNAIPLNSLNGAHHYAHNNINDTLATTAVGNSFRYLLGINGREDTDWEFTVGAGADHNQYAAEARSSDTAVATAGLIGTVCASCHTSFHNKNAGSDTYGINDAATFAAGSWIRHPTDYAMTQTGEFAAYNAYLPNVPLGRTIAQLGAAEDLTNADQRIVLCLSCHRAHGSPYDDMLRWDYSLMQVGNGGGAAGTGCFACHSLKD